MNCPQRQALCPETCPGSILIDWKTNGLHVTDVDMCFGTYLSIRRLPGVQVERLTNGAVIDTNGLPVQYDLPATLS